MQRWVHRRGAARRGSWTRHVTVRYVRGARSAHTHARSALKGHELGFYLRHERYYFGPTHDASLAGCAETAPTKYTSLQVPFGVNSWWETAPHIVWRRSSAAPQGRHMPLGRVRRGAAGVWYTRVSTGWCNSVCWGEEHNTKWGDSLISW